MQPSRDRSSDLATRRVIGICAHIDAGKTTLTERILHLTGRERRYGRVDDGTAVMDWMAEERERGITITAAATRVAWRGHDIDLIDTPGHVDFTIEVERSARVIDGAVLVVDAVAGVQAQTETVWRQLERHRVPCVGFVNKCDRPGADVVAAIETLAERLGARGVPIAYPFAGADGQLAGVVDLVPMRAFTFDPDGAATEVAVPESVRDEALVLRSELLDVLAERDEGLLAALLEEREPAPDEIRRALRARTLSREVVPMACGAALRGIGVQLALDAVVDYLPPPAAADPDAPPLALAFKVHVTAHRTLTYVRVYAGRIEGGMRLWNPRLAAHERVAEVLRMHANSGESLPYAEAGDIVALTGLAETGTGDTLGDRETSVPLEPLRLPEPVLSLVVEPADADEREQVGVALQRLAREDPSFRVSLDRESGQWTVHGMGELHLEVSIGRLKSEHGLEPRVGRPRVAYREALTGGAEGRGVVERTLSGRDAYADVELSVAPLEAAADAPAGPAAPAVEFAADAAVPAAHREAVAAALRGEAGSGPRFGLPLQPPRILVRGGAAKRERDVEAAWVQAAVAALREALRNASLARSVVVLEPLMALAVDAPEEFSSGIIADLNARHAELCEVVVAGGVRRVSAKAPLAELFGYAGALRSLSRGRASCTMQPAGLAPVAEGELAGRGFV